MRNSVAGCLVGFWALVACSGQNVVAGEEKTKSEQLEASLPSWCVSICNRLQQCDVDEECDCLGDTCTCTGSVDEDCAEECREEMSRWAQGSDECAAAGERFKGCLDDSGCDVLGGGDLCSPTEAEQDACPRAGYPDPGDPGAGPSVGNDGGPNYGTGGTSSGGPVPTGGTGMSFTAGSANYDPSATVTCELGYGSGGGTAAAGWPSLVCEEGHEECSDGHDYSMYCVRTSETVTTCSCLVDQQVVGGFDPGGPVCPTSQQMNAGCRWNLQLE